MIISKLLQFKNALKNDKFKLANITMKMSNKEISSIIYTLFYDQFVMDVNFLIKYNDIAVFDAEDIVSEFINETPKIVRKFNPERSDTFMSFIRVALKNFAISKCKFWSRNKRNFATPTDYLENPNLAIDNSFSANNNENLDKIDYKNFLATLTKREFEQLRYFQGSPIFKYRFVSPTKINNYRKILYQKINSFYGNN